MKQQQTKKGPLISIRNILIEHDNQQYRQATRSGWCKGQQGLYLCVKDLNSCRDKISGHREVTGWLPSFAEHSAVSLSPPLPSNSVRSNQTSLQRSAHDMWWSKIFICVQLFSCLTWCSCRALSCQLGAESLRNVSSLTDFMSRRLQPWRKKLGVHTNMKGCTRYDQCLWRTHSAQVLSPHKFRIKPWNYLRSGLLLFLMCTVLGNTFEKGC